MICPCCGKPRKPENLEGLRTALKPAMELIAVARKPLSEKTIAANVLKWGTGALNIDGCRIPSGSDYSDLDVTQGGNRAMSFGMGERKFVPASGRWPANLIHDGSEEVVALFPDSDGQQGDVRGSEPSSVTNGIYGDFSGRVPSPARNDSGSAARFFYTAKADSDDRLGSKHPTVKPVDLMQWLVRLVTPKGGLVLDCFAGSGTTGEAAFREGMRAVLIEREEAYVADIHRRIDLLMAGPDERRRASIKEKIKDGRIKVDGGPLFGGEAA